MIELTIAAQAAFKAYELLKSGVAKGREIEDMGGYVRQFFKAKHDVEKAVEANEKKNGEKDLLSGSALEQAIALVEEQERIAKLEEKIKWMYINKGKSSTWAKIKRESERIEKKRAEVKKKKKIAKTQEEHLIRDLFLVLGILVGGIGLTGGMVFLIFSGYFG